MKIITMINLFKKNLISHYLILLFSVFLYSCQSTKLRKPVVIPQPISVKEAVSELMKKHQPRLNKMPPFQKFPVSIDRLENGMMLYHLKPKKQLFEHSLIALVLHDNANFSQVERDILLHWNLINLPVSKTNPSRKNVRLSSITNNVGTEIKAFTYKQHFGWYLNPDRSQLNKSFALLLEMTNHLAFTQNQFYLARQKLVIENKLNQLNGQSLSWQLFKRLTLSQSKNKFVWDPNQYRQIRKNLSLQQLQQFSSQTLNPEFAKVFIISSENTQKLIHEFNRTINHSSQHLQKFAKISTPAPIINFQAKKDLTPKKDSFIGIDRPSSTQVDIRISYWPRKISRSEKQALDIMIEALAGDSLASRMARDLREKQGLSYYIGGYLSQWPPLASMQFVSSSEPYKLPALIKGMLSHINLMLKKGLSKKSFQHIKQRLLLKNYAHIISQNQQLYRFVKLLSKNQPLKDLSQQSDELEKLQFKDFQNVLHKMQNWVPTIFVVGDKKKIKLALCEYYTKCEIHWYNKELDQITSHF